ncbi:Ig family protein [Candidatus Nitrosopumilus sediminis]|uniref:Ig family protein n=1 Tax=Candidatus Nitrosopumilus sediminis TaxID=1229909 RepID=K0BAI8_9ARCH|nr:CFI-box-CTERM domain-containing protein [Candidatus Nitrosopumilus sediminis]AFS81980.1 Ig family protein [Candidatus Nitrosopumilus sediminis]
MKYFLVFSIFFLVGSAYAQTPFRDTAGLTLNGIEWCEENYQLYYFMGNDFFEHHHHSIESRLCGNLYNDDLWLYSEPDRYQKLIEASRMYYSLEIQESTKEAEEGKIDTKPVNIKEIPQEIEQQQKELEGLIVKESNENNIEIKTVCDEGAELIDGKCWIVDTTEGGGCLIATATYGSEMAPQVQFLREIRDNQLMDTQSGSLFMAGFNQVYYSFSPYVADMERESPLFKELVKIGITPLLSTLSVMSYAESESEVFGYGIGVILMNVGMYIAIPTMLIMKLKRTNFRKIENYLT